MVIMTWQYGSRTWIRITSETAGISSKMMGYPPAGLSPALYQAIVQVTGNGKEWACGVYQQVV